MTIAHLIRYHHILKPTFSIAHRTMSTFTSSSEDGKNWIRTHLSALYSSPDEATFEATFEKTYAPSSHFIGASVNGEQEDRDGHKEALRRVRASCAKPAEVQFGDMEEVESDGQVRDYTLS